MQDHQNTDDIEETAHDPHPFRVRVPEIVKAVCSRSLTKAQYKRYERSPAKTDYPEFEGQPHLHMDAPDWQEVAAAIDCWLDCVLDAPVAVTQQAS